MQPRLARTLTITEDEALSGPPLDVLSDIWTNGRTGWLKVGIRRAAICQGGIVDAAGGELVELALALSNGGSPRAFVMAAEVSFEPGEHEGLADTLSVARSIWAAAVKEADPAFTDRVLHRVLRLTDRSKLCEQLPLSEAIQTLINAPGNRLLSRHLKNLEIAPFDVGKELAALARMGLVRFQRVQRVDPKPAAGEVIQPKSARPAGAAKADAARAKAQNVEFLLLLRRLKREAMALAGADDWTIVGLPQGSSPDRIRAATGRMAARYGGLAKDERQPPEIRKLSAAILSRIERAAENLAHVGGASGADRVGEEAYRLGRVAMKEGRTQDAIKHFAAARARTPDSPRNLGWLGWALFWDESRPVSRKAEALELLQLAAQFNTDELANPAYFLAHVEAERGDIGMAEARLSRMLRKYPDHKRGRRLFLKVRRQRSRGG